MRNVTSYSVALLLAAALAVPGSEAQAQSRVVASVGAGSLFDGVSFGFAGGSLGRSSAFFGLSLGLAWAHSYGPSPYGIYSDTQNGWQRGYRVHHHPYGYYGYGAAGCGSAFWDPYWDPWDPWDGDCLAFAPAWSPMWGYSSYHPWSFGFGFGYSSWYGPSVSVYMADPYATPWGPYWSYDPWAGYWNNWRPGLGWGRGYYGTRVVYAGHRRGWSVYPRSPLGRRGGSYGRPSGGRNGGGRNTGRTAHRRGSAPTARVARPTVDPRAPVVQGNPLGIPGWGDPGMVRRRVQPRGGVGSSRDSGRRAQPRDGMSASPTRGRTVQPRQATRKAPIAHRTTDPRGSSGGIAYHFRGSQESSGRVAPPASAPRSTRAPVRRSMPLRRPTDRLPRSERPGRTPVRAVPRSQGYGRAPAAGSYRRSGAPTPSSRFTMPRSRFDAPQARPSRRAAPRQGSPSGVWTRRSGARASAPRASRPAPRQFIRRPVRAPRPSVSRPSVRVRSAPHYRAPRAAPHRSESSGRRAVPRGRHGGGR